MAAGSFEAGRVHIRVLPDAENFNQKLRPVLEKAKKQAEADYAYPGYTGARPLCL